MKILKKIVLTLLILCAIAPNISHGLNSDFQKNCTYLFEWKDNLNNILVYNGKIKNIKDLTQHFCEKAQTLKCSDSSDWDYIIDYFDASQSIFLSILCESVWKWEWYNQTRSNLKKQNFVDFNIVSSHTWYRESCNRHYWSMNECNYSYNLPLIFNKIMNDFFSIKQARNFWITWLNTPFFSDTPANIFSLQNFPWLDIMLGDKETKSKGICDPNNKYYKTTCKKLKWYMTDANNLLKNTEVIDINELQWKKIEDCENDFKTNILYCGLLWDDSYYKFLNTVYNEYFWYKLFLSYYSFYINGTDYLDKTAEEDIDKIQKNQEKIFLTQDQILKSKQAISMSFQSLSEIHYSFPLHVWFLMYYEDIEYFMKNISKIYTPIRTLYDKLRNVQIKEE
jgi:hypothetical protein